MSDVPYALEQARYEDIELVLATIHGGARFDMIMCLLHDLDAWKDTKALASAKTAVVAPGLLIYGLNRMAHALAGDSENERLAVFRERGQALEWLRA